MFLQKTPPKKEKLSLYKLNSLSSITLVVWVDIVDMSWLLIKILISTNLTPINVENQMTNLPYNIWGSLINSLFTLRDDLIIQTPHILKVKL